ANSLGTLFATNVTSGNSISTNLSINDPNSDLNALFSVNLSVTAGNMTLSATDGLTFITGTGTRDANLVFTGKLSDINKAFTNFIYNSPVDLSNSTTAQINIVSTNLGFAGSGTATSISTVGNILINSVNIVNATVVSDFPGFLQTNENSSGVVFSTANGSGVHVQDPAGINGVINLGISSSSGNLIINNNNPNVTIYANNQYASSSIVNANSIAILGLVSDVNAALEGLKFIPTNNFAGNATVSFFPNYSAKTVTTTTIQVNPIVFPPINVVPTAITVTGYNNYIFGNYGNSSISITDSSVNQNTVMQVSLSVEMGAIGFQNAKGLSFITGTGVYDTRMTFTGKLLDLNSAFSTFEYFAPDPNTLVKSSVSRLIMTTSDLGNSGLGSVATASNVIDIVQNVSIKPL
ncbi:MAG: hypothetical protein ACR2HS_04475, partial [Gammaproteobacteria bacterium]